MTNKQVHLSLLTIAIASLLFAVLLSGLTVGFPGSQKNDLIGIWTDEENPEALTLTFSRDGSFELNSIPSGSYRLEGDEMTLIYSEDTGGLTSIYQVEITDDEKLFLTDHSGNTFAYTKNK